MATSIRDPDIICGFWGICQVLDIVGGGGDHLLKYGEMNISNVNRTVRGVLRERDRKAPEGQHTS